MRLIITKFLYMRNDYTYYDKQIIYEIDYNKIYIYEE
ncbi:hypothetical protein pb186bvf_018529 [Paramecium bursaria]